MGAKMGDQMTNKPQWVQYGFLEHGIFPYTLQPAYPDTQTSGVASAGLSQMLIIPRWSASLSLLRGIEGIIENTLCSYTIHVKLTSHHLKSPFYTRSQQTSLLRAYRRRLLVLLWMRFMFIACHVTNYTVGLQPSPHSIHSTFLVWLITFYIGELKSAAFWHSNDTRATLSRLN